MILKSEEDTRAFGAARQKGNGGTSGTGTIEAGYQQRPETWDAPPGTPI